MDAVIVGPAWYEARLRDLTGEMGRLSERCAWARRDPTRRQELARQEWARLLGEAHRLMEQAGLATRGGR